MSAESELLIKIRTILESQGIDAAKKSLDDLSKTNQSGTLTQAQSTIEMQKATRAAFALRMAVNGSTEGFRGIATAALGMGESLGMLVGRITMVGAAFTAGWKMGTLIKDQLTDPVTKANDQLEALTKNSESSKKILDTLSSISLDKMRESIKLVSDEYTRAVNQAERLNRLRMAKEDIRLAQELTSNQLDFESGGISEVERNRRDLHANTASDLRKLQIEEDSLKGKKLQAQKELDDARRFLEGAEQQKRVAARERTYLQEEAGVAGWSGSDKVNDGNIVDVIEQVKKELASPLMVHSQNMLAEAKATRESKGDFSTPAALTAVERRLKELQAILEFGPRIASAKQREHVADETLRSDEAKSRKALIIDKPAEISDIDSNIKLLPEKRAVVSTKHEAQETQIKNQIAMEQKKNDAEIRTVKLEALRRDFETITDPKELSTLSDQMQSLQIEGISERTPEAIELRKGVIASESQTALQKRNQQVAISIAEQRLEREKAEAYAHPADKKERADVVNAEKSLKEAQDGNSQTIRRILGITESMVRDIKAFDNRMSALENRERFASGLC